MKKNGFVSTSLIYTFFIIFLLLMLFLMNSYSRIRFLLEDYKYDIKESLANINLADVNVLFYVYDNISKDYELVDELPHFNYILDEEFSGCNKGSTITYQNGEITVTARKKDLCYAYFKEIDSDIKVEIYTKESKDSDKVISKGMPNTDYKLESTNCKSGSINFDEALRQFKVTSNGKAECEIVFVRKESDVKITYYKENVNGNKEHNGLKYQKTDKMPGITYTFASYECNNDTVIKFDSVNHELIITSTGKDECNVYFNGGEDRIDILIMQENENGIYDTLFGKKYAEVYSVPGEGFKYVGYSCDPSNGVKFNYSNGTFIVESSFQAVCKAYFNKVESNNALINYYLEKNDGTYEKVLKIPEFGFKYHHGSCNLGSSFTVKDNYVIVDTNLDNEVCNFYYNSITADVIIKVWVYNRSTGKYELSNIPPAGYTIMSKECANGSTIEEINGALKVTSKGQDVCEVYYR